jgi:sulfite reductase beta subunit-like hemoprotein
LIGFNVYAGGKIIRQKNGLYAVSLVVPAGIFTGTDLERVAELAKRYGSGEIRLSTYQNLYIVNTSGEKFRKAGNPLRKKLWQGEGL